MVGRNTPVWLFFANAMKVMQRPVLCVTKTMMNVELKFREAILLRLNCSNIWSHVIERNTMKYVNFAQKIIKRQLIKSNCRSYLNLIPAPGSKAQVCAMPYAYHEFSKGGGLIFGKFLGLGEILKYWQKISPFPLIPWGKFPHDSGQEGGGDVPQFVNDDTLVWLMCLNLFSCLFHVLAHSHIVLSYFVNYFMPQAPFFLGTSLSANDDAHHPLPHTNSVSNPTDDDIDIDIDT